MYDKSDIEKQYLALISKYETTIKLVDAMFYPQGDYHYDALFCDLVTHLWEVYPMIPDDLDEQQEAAWVYAVLKNKAANVVRDEQMRSSIMVSLEQLPDMLAEEGGDSLVERLHRLLEHLDTADSRLIAQYLDGVPVNDIARAMGRSPRHVYRQIKRISAKLKALNHKI